MNFFQRIKLFFTKDQYMPLYWLGETPLSRYLTIKNKNDILTAYYQTPTLRAIIDKLADIFSKVNIDLLNSSGEYIDDFEFAHPFYSQSEFLSTYYKQIKLFNECFIYINSRLPQNIDEQTTFLILPAQNVEVIPRENIDIKQVRTREDIISHYELTINDRVISFLPFEILHVTTSSLKFNENGYLEPDYSLISAEQPINVIRSAYEMRIGLNYRKGGTNILVNDQISDGRLQMLNSNDINNLQQDLAKYSLNKNDYQTIITNAKLQNINLNYPISELQINEGILQAKIDLSDVLGFSLQTLNILEGTTFANKEQSNKEIYTNLIVPGWKLLENEINKFNIDSKEISFNYSEIEALQEDKKTMIETNNLMSDEIIKLNTEVKDGNINRDIAINILVNFYNLNIEQAENYIQDERITI